LNRLKSNKNRINTSVKILEAKSWNTAKTPGKTTAKAKTSNSI
jgi:hypothetical protein